MSGNEIGNIIDLFFNTYLSLSCNSQALMVVLAETMLIVEKEANHVNIEKLGKKVDQKIAYYGKIKPRDVFSLG